MPDHPDVVFRDTRPRPWVPVQDPDMVEGEERYRRADWPERTLLR